MSFRRRLKNKRVPEGFDMIEDVIDDFEQQMLGHLARRRLA